MKVNLELGCRVGVRLRVKFVRVEKEGEAENE